MSKRSYRRLAVVAGAALAVGSMTPAMALRVGSVSGADANVAVDTVDLDQVATVLPVRSADLTSGLGLVTGIAGSLFTTVQAAPGIVVPTALNVAGDALCIPTGVVGTALGAQVDALAGLHIGLGGVGASAGAVGVAGLPIGITNTVVGCTFELAGDAIQAAGAVRGAAAPLVASGLGTAGIVTTAATSVPGYVLGLPGAVFGLGDLLSINAGANAGLGAVLAGIL